MAGFADLKNVTLADAVTPPPIPKGIYHAKITGPFKERKSPKNFAAEFPFMLTAPGDQIDLDELEKAGGLPTKPQAYPFWMSESALGIYGDFARSCGLSDDLGLMDSLQEIGEMCPDVLVEVTHEAIEKDGVPVVDAKTGVPKVRMRFNNMVADKG